MIHLPEQITDLALILIAAAVVTLFFRWIKQPVVLGYIIAGVLVSPHVGWFPSVVDEGNIKVWAEIGVIFLLFALGLEFSFKKLVRVGGSASITAIVEVLGMVTIGFITGKIFGWNAMDSLFLGGVLAISSTTIIIRAFDELGLKSRGFVSLVFGVLIVEDLVAILLMVLLSTLAVSQVFSGGEMIVSATKLGFFLVLWFVSGIFLLPTFLKQTRRLMSAETMLVVSLGLCFLMVVLATKAGFSPALGAFIMGSILAETMEGEKIEKLIHPVKDLFAAVFFVSVGMMIEPKVLQEYAVPIFVITLVTIVGKTFSTFAGALLSGRSLRHSVQAGMSLAQIGEFSFIIAGLGLSLKVTSDFLYPIAISVSAVTTFTTPYMIRSADTTVRWLERTLPAVWLESLNRFSSQSQSAARSSEWRKFLITYFLKIGANLVVVVAVSLATSKYFWPWLDSRLDNPLFAASLSLLLSLVLSSPFLWALVFRRIGDRSFRYKAPLFMLESIRWFLAFVLIAFLAGQFISAWALLVSLSAVTVLTLFFLSRYLQKVYIWMEGRFLSNLTEKERAEESKKLPPLAPWDAHLTQLTISPHSPLVGKKLSQATIRERFGITIAMIGRGHRMIAAPGRDEVIYPHDVLHVIGTDEQIGLFKAECEVAGVDSPGEFCSNFGLQSFLVDSNSRFAHRSIRECGLREETQCLVVGIEKNGVRILNPDSGTKIEPHDILWIVGDRLKIHLLETN